MVCEWGMSDVIGTVALDERSDNGQYLGVTGYREKLYSEKTAQQIDQEVRRILDEAYHRALDIINQNRDIIDLLAQMLLVYETLDAEDVKKIVAREWNEEEKQSRLKTAEELHKKPIVQATIPPPPPPLINREDSATQTA